MISASFTTVAAYGSRSRHVVAASWVPPLLLALAIAFLTTLAPALPRALAVAPTPSVYLPHSRAGRAEATERGVASSPSERRGRARVWREVGRPQRSEDGRVRGNPTETRAQAALTLDSLGSSAVPYVGDYGSAAPRS